MAPSTEPARNSKGVPVDVHMRLQARRAEIESVVRTRVLSLVETEALSPEYLDGLAATIPAALTYGLSVIERGEAAAATWPPVLLTQARLAARTGVSLHAVLHRYFVGYTLLADFLVEEAERGEGLGDRQLQRLLRAQALALDRVLGVVKAEYDRERSGEFSAPRERAAERVERLLAGESIDISDLGYELDSHHLGVLAKGDGAAEAIHASSAALERNLLFLRRAETNVWAWLGGSSPLDPNELRSQLSRSSSDFSLAIGEPGEGVAGWRRTHDQARAALRVALSGRRKVVRYADVALVASALGDDLLTTSLRNLYLAPLQGTHDGGATAYETLRAYFHGDCNVASTASALGVKRHTVTNRLRRIEEQLSRTLRNCAAEVDLAMRVEELTR